MFKNVTIKRFLINYIMPIFSALNRMIPKDDHRILIYCSNDRLKDNAGAVFEYLVKNQYYEKYKIICCTENHEGYDFVEDCNVQFKAKQLGILQYLRSKYVFYSSGKIPIKPTKDQMVINMLHGTTFKKLGQLSKINNGEEFFFTYVCAASEMYIPIMTNAFGCPEKNVCLCGEPKTDKLFRKKELNNNLKFVVWVPTFRQSKYLGYDDSTMNSFLPLIENNEWDQLNNELKRLNIQMMVKLHPAQNMYHFTEKKFSNLEIYNDEIFRSRGYDLYDILSQSDALITDYSSVCLEYLLLNRPIGFTLNDMEEYNEKRGFVFDNPLDFMPGEKMYSKKDLIRFLENISNDIDEYTTERKRVNNLVNKYQDDKNCQRLLEIAGIVKS